MKTLLTTLSSRAIRAAFTFVVALAALAPAGFSAQAAPAAQPQVGLAARGGFGDGGHYMIGEWFPVRIALTNPQGAPSMRVRVEVDSQSAQFGQRTGVYAREVDLPASSRKEVTLYTYSGAYSREVEVRLVRDGTIIGKVKARLNPLERGNNILVGVVSQDASLLNVLRGEPLGHFEPPFRSQTFGYYPPPGGTTGLSRAEATVANMGLEEIPALSAALDSLGALVMDDVNTGSLQTEQRQALAAWVGRGGSLTVVARPGAAETASGLADLLPVAVSGAPRTLSSLSSLSDLVAVPITASAPVIVADAALKTGPEIAARVLASQDGAPLVVVRDLGRGQVIYLALSPGTAPLKGWNDGLVPLFKRLLAEHELRPSAGATRRNAGYSSYGYNYYGGPNKVFDTYSSIFDWPGLELPDPILIGIFLFLYIIVIGPVNFIVLRRMRRTELAWITIPALVALFSVAAYLLAYQAKGGDLVAIRASIMHTVAGLQRANATQVLGLFSPTRGTYSLQVDEESGVTEINAYGYSSDNSNPAYVLGGSPTTLDNVTINTWTLRGFMAENSVAAESPIEADLRLEDNLIEGTIRNRSSRPLRDVALIRGGAVQHIGLIAPGQRAEVKLAVTTRNFYHTSPATLLPTPPGVVVPVPGYNYSPPPNNPAQRAYNRQVEFLNMALYPMLDDHAPDDFQVLVLAWGAEPPARFSLTNRTASYEDISIWMGHFPVVAGQNPRLKAGSVPYSVYAPGNDPVYAKGPVSATQSGGLSLSGSYADIRYRLPASTRPDTLKLEYSASSLSGELAVLAYNTRTGNWDRLGQMSASATTAMISIPDPRDYVGPAGDVTTRLLIESGNFSANFRALELSLNEIP